MKKRKKSPVNPKLLRTVGIALLPAVGVAVEWGTRWALTKWDKRRQPDGVQPAPIEECWCGKTMDSRTAHRVVDSQDDSEIGLAPGGSEGTAMVAEFCKEHCPGGCNRGCKPTDKQSGHVVRRSDGS